MSVDAIAAALGVPAADLAFLSVHRPSTIDIYKHWDEFITLPRFARHTKQRLTLDSRISTWISCGDYPAKL